MALYRRKRRSKLSLRTSGLPRLQKALDEARIKHQEAAARLEDREREFVSFADDAARAKQRLSVIVNRIQEISQAPGNRLGFWQSLLSASSLVPHAHATVENLRKDREQLERLVRE